MEHLLYRRVDCYPFPFFVEVSMCLCVLNTSSHNIVTFLPKDRRQLLHTDARTPIHDDMDHKNSNTPTNNTPQQLPKRWWNFISPNWHSFNLGLAPPEEGQIWLVLFFWYPFLPPFSLLSWRGACVIKWIIVSYFFFRLVSSGLFCWKVFVLPPQTYEWQVVVDRNIFRAWCWRGYLITKRGRVIFGGRGWKGNLCDNFLWGIIKSWGESLASILWQKKNNYG